MPRRPIVLRKKVSLDPKYNDPIVGRFLSILMKDGKRSTVERVCYGAFDLVQEKTGNDPLKVFHAALGNVKPVVEVSEREETRKVFRPIVEQDIKEEQVTMYRPVTKTETQWENRSGYVDVPQREPGAVRTRLRWLPRTTYQNSQTGTTVKEDHQFLLL